MLQAALPGLGLLTAAVAAGVLTVNLWGLRGGLPTRAQPGVAWTATHLLRVGVALLGLRLALPDIGGLGALAVLVVVGIAVLTFLGTRLLASVLGLSRANGLLLAAGYAICGASAIAAVSATVDHDEEDVAAAVAMVTLCGSLSIVVLPVLGGLMGLPPVEFGAWVGASVHDVGQVVATASTAGPQALDTAVVVKLTRVALLAPLVAALALAARRGAMAGASAGHRPPLVPLFVVGFGVAVLARSSGLVPDTVLEVADAARALLLAAALFALGLGVRLGPLLRRGRGTMVVGMLAWVLVASLALAAVALGWLT